MNLHSFPTRRSSDLRTSARVNIVPCSGTKKRGTECYRSVEHDQKTGLTTFGQFHQHHSQMPRDRSEERFSRNAETDLVCRLLLEKKKIDERTHSLG